MDQSKWIEKMEKEGVRELTSGGFGYKDCLVEVDEVEWDVTGPKTNHDFMKSWTPEGQVMLIIYFKVIKGDHKGIKFNIIVPLFTQNGDLRMFLEFKGKDGETVPASELGEIIHKIKEYDEKQWNKDPFKPAKLIGCKFEIGIRANSSDTGAWALAAFERQLAKDKKYQEEKGSAKTENKENKTIPMKEESKEPKVNDTEEKIEPEDLPF